MFGGNLGEFSNGVFGGMKAIQQIALTNQALQQQQYQLDAAKAVQDASSDPTADAPGDFTPDSGSQNYGSTSSAIPSSSSSASSQPVANPSKIRMPASTQAAQGNPDADAVDPLSAGDGAPPAAAPPLTADDAKARIAARAAAAGDGGGGYNPVAAQASGALGASYRPDPVLPPTPAPATADADAAPQGMSAGTFLRGVMGAPAASGDALQTAAGTPAPAAKPSLGASILGAIVPSAQADTVARLPIPAQASGATPATAALALPMAKQDDGTAAPATPDDNQGGALAATIARMRQDTGPSSDPAPGAIQAPGRQTPGTAPDARTSDQVTSRATFDQRPWLALEQQSPQTADMLVQAGEKYNVNPARIALHWNNESGMRPTAPDSATGDMGPLQINKNTLPMLDPQGTRDPRSLPGAIDLAAQNIHLADTRYGKDTPLSVGAYQGGNGSADAIAHGEADHHPETMAYIAKSFPGQTITPDQLQPGHQMDPAGIVQAAQNQGPDGVLNYVARSGPPGAPMSDKWRQAESALMTAAAAKGDTAGMEHARDFVFQMLHQGNATSLMNAYRQLSAGDPTGAAQQLARANAFFPDGSMGRFGVDSSGGVWAQRVDEHDPTKNVGAPTQITPEKLQGMMIQAQDPNQFAAALSAQQKAMSDLRLMQIRQGYYAQMPTMKKDIAAGQNATRQAIATARNAATLQVAQTHADAQRYSADSALARSALGATAAPLPVGVNGLKANQVDTESTKFYSAPDPTTGAVMSPDQASTASQIHQDLRMNTPGMSPLTAKSLTLGLVGGQNVLRSVGSGMFGIYPRNAQNGSPRAVINAATAAHLQNLMLPGGLGDAPIGGALGHSVAPADASSGALAGSLAAVPISQSALPMGY